MQKGDVYGTWNNLLDKQGKSELMDLGVPAGACGDIIQAMIHSEMVRLAGRHAGAQRQPTVGDYQDGIHWVQTQNSFVCIFPKRDDQSADSESERLISYLNQAFLAWHPNLFQILMSEIQNVLELEALVTADELLREATTHTALWCYLLSILEPIDPTSSPDVNAPLMDVIDKIVDGIRRRLSADNKLLDLASDALLGEIKNVGWTKETWPNPNNSDMGVKASEIARTKGIVDNQDVFFRLNSFFGTEKFRHAHLTTGAICFDSAKNEYFVLASPACDLVTRQPREEQIWAHSIYPLMPVVAICLRSAVSIDSALSKATSGQYIFLEYGTEKKVFKIVNKFRQPSCEFFFAIDGGKTHNTNGKILFNAIRLTRTTKNGSEGNDVCETEEDRRIWANVEFEIIGQLRNMNATRVLQMAGQHLSRIGLDFLNMKSM